MANLKDRRKSSGRGPTFPIRRATISEAQGARKLIEATFTDRISWVAARTLLQRVVTEIDNSAGDPKQRSVSLDLDIAIRRFLERHPAPERSPAQVYEDAEKLPASPEIEP